MVRRMRSICKDEKNVKDENYKKNKKDGSVRRMRKMKKIIRMSRRNFPASNERYRHWKENRPVTTEGET